MSGGYQKKNPMFFLLTKFIYPIKKPIKLSEYFDFVFDNPRNAEEIETVAKLIKKSWDLSENVDSYRHQRLPMQKEKQDEDCLTFESVIYRYLKKYNDGDFAQKEIKKIQNKKEKIIEFYAKNWVIIRYDTNEMVVEHERIEQIAEKMRTSDKKDKTISLILLDDDNVFDDRENQLSSYSSLLSLMNDDPEYFGWDFLLIKNRFKMYEFSSDVEIMSTILNNAIGIDSDLTNSDGVEYNFEIFMHFIGKFAVLIDKNLKNEHIKREELLYIGSVLNEINPMNSKYSSLVRLVGIMEMILTHSPDHARYNVEESITKQFVLKVAIITHLVKNDISLSETKRSLKEIYSQRSSIVHGNFLQVQKFKDKLKKEDRYFDDLIHSSYIFCRIVLTKYLEDPGFIKFLKDN